MLASPKNSGHQPLAERSHEILNSVKITRTINLKSPPREATDDAKGVAL